VKLAPAFVLGAFDTTLAPPRTHYRDTRAKAEK